MDAPNTDNQTGSYPEGPSTRSLSLPWQSRTPACTVGELVFAASHPVSTPPCNTAEACRNLNRSPHACTPQKPQHRNPQHLGFPPSQRPVCNLKSTVATKLSNSVTMRIAIPQLQGETNLRLGDTLALQQAFTGATYPIQQQNTKAQETPNATM